LFRNHRQLATVFRGQDHNGLFDIRGEVSESSLRGKLSIKARIAKSGGNSNARFIFSRDRWRVVRRFFMVLGG